MQKFYIVDSSILPEVLDKVIEARTLLLNGEVRQVSEAVKKLGSAEERTINIKIMSFSQIRG